MADKLLLLCLLWCLVEVHSQTAPYLTFMGKTLPNHAYVDLSRVGDDAVQCHTDLDSCCTSVQGPHSGSWFPPSSKTLSSEGGDVYQTSDAQQVDLHHKNSVTPSKWAGIYCCNIATVADQSEGESVYIGLYESGGMCNYISLYAQNITLFPITRFAQ